MWVAATVGCLLVAVGVAGYTLISHLNGNIKQANVRPLLGHQPPDLHPQAENIVVIGSDGRQGQTGLDAPGLVTDQSDTLMIIHIPASRQWAEVMSIPRDSWVPIPSCMMGNGQMSSPTQFKINEAFAVGNLHGNHTATGAACTIKTVEQDTGIYIDHFIVVNFNGFRDMVAALGGVPECNPTAIDDPQSGLSLSAGWHLLTPNQALTYVRARYGLGDGSDLERIGRQQVFMSSLISRARSKLFDPVAIYRFLDAATRSVTIDSQLGGISGLYGLEQGLHGIPSGKIVFFTLPSFPRELVVPSDTANVLWTEPEDDQIFTSFRDDVPASPALFTAQATTTTTRMDTSPSPASGLAVSSVLEATPSPTPIATEDPAPTTTPSPVTIQGRAASQSICVG
ncbi:MAG: transcriptional regulator [Actinomycetia bacterium]|nr:transcriptional regulator [Actinomycetes bacterium]